MIYLIYSNIVGLYSNIVLYCVKKMFAMDGL